MAALEAIFYGIARGVFRAWFEMSMAAKLAEHEVPDDEALRMRDRFRVAVDKLRSNETRPS